MSRKSSIAPSTATPPPASRRGSRATPRKAGPRRVNASVAPHSAASKTPAVRRLACIQTYGQPFRPRAIATIRVKKAPTIVTITPAVISSGPSRSLSHSRNNASARPQTAAISPIEFSPQVRGDTVMAQQIPHQAVERGGEDGRDRTPRPERLGGRVQHDHNANDGKGGKRDRVEHLDQSGAEMRASVWLVSTGNA